MKKRVIVLAATSDCVQQVSEFVSDDLFDLNGHKLLDLESAVHILGKNPLSKHEVQSAKGIICLYDATDQKGPEILRTMTKPLTLLLNYVPKIVLGLHHSPESVVSGTEAMEAESLRKYCADHLCAPICQLCTQNSEECQKVFRWFYTRIRDPELVIARALEDHNTPGSFPFKKDDIFFVDQLPDKNDIGHAEMFGNGFYYDGRRVTEPDAKAMLLQCRKEAAQAARQKFVGARGDEGSAEETMKSTSSNLVSLALVGEEEVYVDRKKVLYYKVRVRTVSEEWDSYKRYSALHALHQQIVQLDTENDLPPFPPKLLFPSESELWVRRKALELWTAALLDVPMLERSHLLVDAFSRSHCMPAAAPAVSSSHTPMDAEEPSSLVQQRGQVSADLMLSTLEDIERQKGGHAGVPVDSLGVEETSLGSHSIVRPGATLQTSSHVSTNLMLSVLKDIELKRDGSRGGEDAVTKLVGSQLQHSTDPTTCSTTCSTVETAGVAAGLPQCGDNSSSDVLIDCSATIDEVVDSEKEVVDSEKYGISVLSAAIDEVVDCKKRRYFCTEC
eukprot:Rmarinus@m.9425